MLTLFTQRIDQDGGDVNEFYQQRHTLKPLLNAILAGDF